MCIFYRLKPCLKLSFMNMPGSNSLRCQMVEPIYCCALQCLNKKMYWYIFKFYTNNSTCNMKCCIETLWLTVLTVRVCIETDLDMSLLWRLLILGYCHWSFVENLLTIIVLALDFLECVQHKYALWLLRSLPLLHFYCSKSGSLCSHNTVYGSHRDMTKPLYLVW